MHRFFVLTAELLKAPIARLRTLFANRRVRLALKCSAALLASVVITVACVLQFWLFPRINDYREDLASRVGVKLGVAVDVGSLHAEWSTVYPRFVLNDVVVFDAGQRPAVQLDTIAATLSWWEILFGNIGFKSLDVVAPALDFRRDAAGRLFLAGLPLGGGGDFRVDALLEQGELSFTSRRLTWSDALRAAPMLVFRDVSLRLRTSDERHRLDVAFTPPESLGSPFSGRVKWVGRSFADWAKWQLNVTLKTGFVDLAGWRPWLTYPVDLTQGRGKLDITLESTGLDLTFLKGNLGLTDLKVRLAPNLDPLVLRQARADVEYKQRHEGKLTQIRLNGLTFSSGEGLTEPASDIFIQRHEQGTANNPNILFVFNATQLDLGRLHTLTTQLPIPDDVRKRLAKMQPSGVLNDVSVEARIRDTLLSEYEVAGGFTNLSLRSEDGSRYVRGLSGKIDLNHESGKLNLNSSGSVLASPGLLPINEVSLSKLSGQLNWQKRGDALNVKVKSLRLENDDLQASVNGTWSGDLSEEASERDRAGMVDMKLVFDNAKTTSGWKYVPLSASADISDWMKGAISDGTISDFRIEMAGAVWDMPYGSPEPGKAPGSSEATGAAGKFLLVFKTNDLTVKYGDGYPPLKKLDAHFVMNQNRIEITANEGWINDMKFVSIKAVMPDVSAFENHLVITGEAQGSTQSAVRFLNETPVAGHIHHFADSMSALGNGKLNLMVDLNLLNAADVKIKGEYTFQNNSVTVLAGAPPVTGLNGTIHFSEASMDSSGLQGQWSGQPLSVSIATDGQAGTRIEASGRATVAELRQHYGLALFDQLSGQTSWQARIGIREGKTDLTLNADLKGLTSSLPEPFNKTAGATMPLNVVRQTAPGSRRGENAVDQIWRVSLGNALGGTLGLNTRGQVVRGRVILGAALPPVAADQTGIQLESVRPVNLDFWMKALGFNVGGTEAKAKGRRGPLAVTQITLKAPMVTAFGRRFQDFRVTVQPSAEKTVAQVASRELQGELDWFPPGKAEGGERGLLQGRLSRLDLTAATDSQASSQTPRSEVESLPDLAFRVDELYWQGKPWGRLNFRARNQASGADTSWRIDPLRLEGPDLRFTGRLNWVLRGGASRVSNPQGSMTALDFKMQSPQVGNLLTKLGFPGTVKRGTAELEGQVSWPSNPFAFNPGRLSGNYKLTAKNGQFVKMDPGAGRLLGLLSLQSLPQRLSLDFRDIFSEGLAFEAIEGRFDIRDGLMKTSDLEMDTPAARILMRGETDLAEQTQDVVVQVRPALSNSVALGVTVINPIVGAATFVTQKVLGDPLSKLFSYQYHITGTWSDPLVDKESIATNAVKIGKDVVNLPVDAASTVGSAITSTVTGGDAGKATGDKP